MKELNKGGALETVLGKETVTDLRKVAKAGEVISDSVMRGKTGLAAAGYAAGFATALILEPISTLTGAAAILALSRALRTKPIMRYLSSPRLRAYEAKRAMQAGADLTGFGRRNLVAEQARESALRALRTILVDAGYYAAGQGANIAGEVVTSIREDVQQSPAPIQPPNIPVAALAQVAQAQETPQQRAARAMLETEQAKLGLPSP
jgi:hypothetical protein